MTMPDPDWPPDEEVDVLFARIDDLLSSVFDDRVAVALVSAWLGTALANMGTDNECRVELMRAWSAVSHSMEMSRSMPSRTLQ